MSRLLVLCSVISLTLSVYLVRLASQQALLVVEAEARLEQVTEELEVLLDTRCRNDHERLMAITRWYIMRRSGQDELTRFEQREAAWATNDSQP